ncbi:SpoIIE family protein phosphatase [Streptomyces radicis]|uniref:protein-serine/threonine phosphatase n=1 Tax=Streptomyces radicis TaxID=1750517 RepID=A0A3A9WR07_9ACTN|nr:SpoIIE family protein phosphatase [Streptomyces radicis]RKN10196.1 GAF domain-containing protein [Streptomyces radicis]RKN24538.1 GAF domain-containing protein [Streptomyces radicis]
MGDTPPPGPDLLDPPLLRAVRETGAYGGAIYLLDHDRRVLRLAVLTGLPVDILRPWLRVGLKAPFPPADAVRERRTVWIGVGEMAVQYPQVGMVLPYPFASAFEPISVADADGGALALLWSGGHPADLGAHERDALTAGARRVGALLLDSLLDAGEPGPAVPAPAEPRVIPQEPPRRSPLEEARAAVALTERLPEGHCALDLDGRITFVNDAAAALIGVPVGELRGLRLWESLPWLSDPVFEDRFRGALLSRTPTAFTALRPPERWLRFQQYPDVHGVSVRIAPTLGATAERAADGPGLAGTPHERAPAAAHALSPTTPGHDARAAPTRPGALYHLMQLATVLTEAVGVRDVVDLVASQIMPSLDAQGLLIFVAEGGRLRLAGFRGYGPEARERFDGTPLDSPASPAARVLSEGEPVFYASPEDLEPRYAALPAVTGKAAWAVLPLIASGRTVGCCVIAYDRPHPFSAEERAVMTSLGGLIAQALERARLYDAKHHLARRLQAGLLPRVLPDVPGLDVAARYLPATEGMEIGGDFYDLIRLGGDTAPFPAAAAAIGDVQGHNVKAAALMGQVRTAVHATAGAPPGEVLARANRLLTDLDPGLFTSCLYVHLDLRTHRARLATAGHLPPLLRRPDGRVTTLPVMPGPLLGIERHAEYPTMEIPLLPGAVLVLYTDGLVERHDRDLDDCVRDLAGHVARARPEGGMDRLADDLLSRARRSKRFTDDIALLLLSPT